MIRMQKLAKLSESMGAHDYRNKFRELLGIKEGRYGEPVLDPNSREIEAKDFNLQEVAFEFLGRDYASKLTTLGQQLPMVRAMEADGTVVLPSHFSHISAFDASVGGLIDAMVLEAYQAPEFIGDKFVETKPARVQGGKAIKPMNDGGDGLDLTDSEPYPAVGLKETYVTIPENKRMGNLIQVNQKVFIYDRTGEIEAAATNAGYATRRNKEIKIADQVLGNVNNYSRDGQAANTYQKAATAVPNNYINASQNALVDWTQLDIAMVLMQENTDPGTGFEISVNPQEWCLFVDIGRHRNVMHLTRATTVETLTQTLASRRFGPNPLEAQFPIYSSPIWRNRLLNAGVSTANTLDRWHLIHPTKAYQWRQIIPFESIDVPISSEEARRDIVMVKVVREHGVAWTKEPRYAYQGTNEP